MSIRRPSAWSPGHKIWGIPYKADVKSTIWYPIKAFEAKGYTVPKTWDELIALSDKIVADGTNPWCVSAGGPGTATGWQITDWVEEVVLKTKGRLLQRLDQPQGHVPRPGHQGRLRQGRQDLLHPQVRLRRQHGDRRTDQKTPMDPMFTDDLANPKCWMQKIPTWYGPDFFPDQRASGKPSKYVIGTDVGIFPFPTIDPAQNYAEGSADTLMVLVDRPEVRAVAEFLATPEGIQNWIAPAAPSRPTQHPCRLVCRRLQAQGRRRDRDNAAGIGFDASDLMPARSARDLLDQSVQWANNGGTNTDAVLKAIDDSWPAPVTI